jgi:hypothetical protein
VRVQEHRPGFSTWTVCVGADHTTLHSDDSAAKDHCHVLRREVSAAVLAAVERALTQCPVPSPVSDARLGVIRDVVCDGTRGWLSSNVTGLMLDLFAHLDHLTRVLHDCGQDGTAAVWRAGYEAGRQAMAQEVIAAQAGPGYAAAPHDRMPGPSGPGKLGL